jgi:hypothetical protein
VAKMADYAFMPRTSKIKLVSPRACFLMIPLSFGYFLIIAIKKVVMGFMRFPKNRDDKLEIENGAPNRSDRENIDLHIM